MCLQLTTATVLVQLKYTSYWCCNRYEELNVRLLDTVRQYSANIPQFLHNRPKFFLDHCLKRMPPVTTAIPPDNIVMSESGVFVVTSVDTADKNYVVKLRSDSNADVPSCECVDWHRHFLPCKHLLAVVHSSYCEGWTSLPLVYRSLPLFTADPDIEHARSSTSVPSVSGNW